MDNVRYLADYRDTSKAPEVPAPPMRDYSKLTLERIGPIGEHTLQVDERLAHWALKQSTEPNLPLHAP